VDPERNLKGNLSLLTTQLLRSAEYPLHVSIQYSGPMNLIQSMLSTLFTSIQRWYHLTGITDFQAMFNYLPDVITPLPLLTSLELFDIGLRVRSVEMLQGCSNLKFLEIDLEDLLLIKLPLSRIQSLTLWISQENQQEYRRLIKESSVVFSDFVALEGLTISVLNTQLNGHSGNELQGAPISPNFIQFPCKSLTLRAEAPSDVLPQFVLHNLRFPFLHGLHLQSLASSDVELVCAMLRKSECKLEGLVIDLYMSGEDVLKLCQGIPTLRKLSIGSFRSFKNSTLLVDELARSASFLPNLVQLDIEIYDDVEESALYKLEETLTVTRPGLEFTWYY
jgi:hypothetical protein